VGPPTQSELVLSARIAELEKTATQQNGRSIWEYITSVLPAPVLVIAGIVFLSFNAWDYYNKGQQDAAKTKIEKAEAALAALEGTTANLKIEDVPAQTAKLKADLQKGQAAARLARTDADALNNKIDQTTVALQALQAELANKQAQAAKARAAADAAMIKEGYVTLEDRAARAKLIVTEMKAAWARADAQGAAGWNQNSGVIEGTVRGLCEGNRYAALINCPLRYIAEVDPAAAKKIADEQAARDAAKRAEEEKQKKLKEQQARQKDARCRAQWNAREQARHSCIQQANAFPNMQFDVRGCIRNKARFDDDCWSGFQP